MMLQNKGLFENSKVNYQNHQLKKTFDLLKKENQKRISSNPELQRIWDDNKRNREKQRGENIARKIARGAQVTAEERAFLERTNPELLKKADEAKKAAEELKSRLKSAKSKEEVKDIVVQANSVVVEMGKIDVEFAGLLKEGNEAVIKEHKESSSYKRLPEEERSKKSHNRKEDGQSIDYFC